MEFRSKLKVGYIRVKAFATNSSSTHTPVIVSGKLPEDYLVEDCEFGWQPFVAASEEAKRKYAGMALFHLLCAELDMDEGLAVSVVKDWVGVEVSKDGYIDHDSLPGLILSYDQKKPHREFFDDYLKWLLQPNLVMLGGNDNEHTITYSDYGTETSKPIPDEISRARGRKDPKGFYTLFSDRCGTKSRLAFSEGADMSSSTTPELVDLKITNYCTKGCKFCYQDSTPSGLHADKEKISRMVYAFKDLEVFEVALGGGEPTSHPDFLEFLTDFRRQGIVPNFTTRDLNWMNNSEFVEVVKKNCGGFAYSIDSGNDRDVETYAKALIKAGLEGKGTVQTIVRQDVYDWEIERLLSRAGEWKISVTLLGWKPVGRGLTYRKRWGEFKPLDWKKILENHHYPRVSIDTTLASQYKQELKEAGVPDWCLSTTEGTHSMYIDAVEGKMGPSSFCDPKEYIECHCYTAEIIRGAFSQFTHFAKEKDGVGKG